MHFNFLEHILIVGKTEKARHQHLARILEGSDLELIRFPKSMKSISDYLDVIQSKKLFFLSYEIKKI